MLIYLDTNIILARFASNEVYHEEAKELLNKIENGRFFGSDFGFDFSRGGLHHKPGL